MRHTKLLGFLLWAMVFLTLALSAPALSQSSVQLPQTGQTKCYDPAGDQIACASTGQDGDLQAGAVWPTPRFTTGTGTEVECIIDNLTGLMWPRNANLPNGTKGWNEAIDYANGLTLCGYSDWHLPNVNELETLVNANVWNSAAWLNSQDFTNVQSDNYWSSTTESDWRLDAPAVSINLRDGVIYTGNTNSYSVRYVWPVRVVTLPPTRSWRTGQIISYRAGDDGDLKQGAPWPDPRFTDHDDGTVTDNLTGLMWTRDASASGPSVCNPGTNGPWRQYGLDYVKCLNTNNYLGHSDWRLPNRKELLSLSDRSNYGPALPLGHPFLNVLQNNAETWYWSSTTCANKTVDAWEVDIWSGDVPAYDKDYGYNYVWPVRAGLGSGSAYNLVINKTGAGTGTVSVDPGTLVWSGTAGTATYSDGKSVTMKAQASFGSAFSGWTGCDSFSGTRCRVTMISNKAVTASFTLNPLQAVLLPQTGQTRCYDSEGVKIACVDTGQDSDIQAGLAWPNPRFTVVGECITDNLTGLMWPRNGNLTNDGKSWYDAIDYANGLTLCGHSDWHLPNVNELESLVNADAPNIGDWLNAQGFTIVPSDGFYWSSTTYSHGTDHAWIVTDRGNVWGWDKTQTFAVLPVRAVSALPAQPWKTGQTTSYRSGDDGDLKRGAPWPSPRFTDQDNGTVTDNLTGLVWTKDADTPGPSSCGPGTHKTWQGALDYVACLNSYAYLGYSDWRLPNRKEMLSLRVLPASCPFVNVMTGSHDAGYWSSTTVASDTGAAWFIDMWSGAMDPNFSKLNAPSNMYVWPVRTGQVTQSVHGKCGPADGKPTASAPTTDLCAAGTPSSVSGNGPWIWTCAGLNGGTPANCSANLPQQFTLTVLNQTENGGLGTATATGINCGTDCTETYSSGTAATLTATPATGSAVSWKGCDSSSELTCQVTMTDNRTVTASFSIVPFVGVHPPKISVSTLLVNFGKFKLQQHKQKHILVKNNGKNRLITGSFNLTGDFVVSKDYAVIDPKDGYAISVYFNPKSYGIKTATLTIPTNDPNKPTITITLKGVCVPPKITVASSLNFGTKKTGTTTTKRLTIKNTGLSELHINAIESPSFGSAFSISDDKCTGASLKQGGECHVEVAFAPSAKGIATETIAITSTDPDPTRTMKTVSLKGTGK